MIAAKIRQQAPIPDIIPIVNKLAWKTKCAMSAAGIVIVANVMAINVIAIIGTLLPCILCVIVVLLLHDLLSRLLLVLVSFCSVSFLIIGGGVIDVGES
ncbi:hypothetical protein [Wolbachia endosymbiont (group B) of Xanthorhoe designata]|uniref:hypothetical protein n=1 Tax=Wolbachia endosymbiont (group B) of Xanthorhoe designata TaxID=3066184 RepID=UPI00333F513E